MKILGINYLSESSVALIENGKLKYAISEERLNRIKNWWGNPFKAVDYVLKETNNKINDIDFDYKDNLDGIGKLGINIEKSIKELNVKENNFYIFDTCNRGPLLIDNYKLKQMNYLDERNYFLDNSEHDLMIRARLSKNYICGYFPIDFYAPLKHGSTRNRKIKLNFKNVINLIEFKRLITI